jgi:SNF2-related domain
MFSRHYSNHRSSSHRTLLLFAHIIVYTGTPIHNSLEDLLALIRFLRHEPWSDPAWWRKVIAGTKRLHNGF